MAKQIITIPDIGGAEDVDVIEILVNVGDQVTQEQSLITLEGDKASMEVPAPMDGTVTNILIHVGDKVSEGTAIIELDAASDTADASTDAPAESAAAPVLTEQTVTIPDIGGADNVDVIEILVNVGDQVDAEQSLITLEGDKASMEVPAPMAGKVLDILVKVGDKVSEGSAIITLEAMQAATPTAPKQTAPIAGKAQAAPMPAPQQPASNQNVHASPAVRRLAYELDINLAQVRGTGDKGRITKDDIKKFLSGGALGGAGIPAMPSVDFSKFGDIETQALSKIKRLTGQNMTRNWLNVPMVTQFDEADITELEAFRKANKDQVFEKEGARLTPLVFIIKAVVKALQQFPQFNSSLDANGENLILKKYFHIGVAVDTPNGLVVPVLRDCDQKSLVDLAKELAHISSKARETGLSVKEMQGGCFTISSLGGIGGSYFTPIVNAPEAAILGVSRSQMKPIYQKDGSFAPRLMLPLALSYDHRIIDGADGARFVTFLSQCLADIEAMSAGL